MNFDSFTFIIKRSKYPFPDECVWLLPFLAFIRSFEGQVERGTEEFICRRTPPLSLFPPSISLKTDFLCSQLSSSVIFLQGQTRWLHILCDVREECKRLNESLDEMWASRKRLISNKTNNLPLHFDQISDTHPLAIFVGPLSHQILHLVCFDDCADKMCPSRKKVIPDKQDRISRMMR